MQQSEQCKKSGWWGVEYGRKCGLKSEKKRVGATKQTGINTGGAPVDTKYIDITERARRKGRTEEWVDHRARLVGSSDRRYYANIKKSDPTVTLTVRSVGYDKRHIRAINNPKVQYTSQLRSIFLARGAYSGVF